MLRNVETHLKDAREALEIALAELESMEDQEVLAYMVGADLHQLKITIRNLEEMSK